MPTHREAKVNLLQSAFLRGKIRIPTATQSCFSCERLIILNCLLRQIETFQKRERETARP